MAEIKVQEQKAPLNERPGYHNQFPLLPDRIVLDAIIPPTNHQDVKESPASHRVQEIRQLSASMGLKSNQINIATTPDQYRFLADIFRPNFQPKVPQSAPPSPEQVAKYMIHRSETDYGLSLPAFARPNIGTIQVPHGLDGDALVHEVMRMPDINARVKSLYKFHLDLENNPDYAPHFAQQQVVHELAHLNDPDGSNPYAIMTDRDRHNREAGSDIAAYVVGKYQAVNQLERLQKELKDHSIDSHVRDSLTKQLEQAKHSLKTHEDFYSRYANFREDSPDYIHNTALALHTVISNQTLQNSLMNILSQGGAGFLDECDRVAHFIYQSDQTSPDDYKPKHD